MQVQVRVERLADAHPDDSAQRYAASSTRCSATLLTLASLSPHSRLTRRQMAHSCHYDNCCKAASLLLRLSFRGHPAPWACREKRCSSSQGAGVNMEVEQDGAVRGGQRGATAVDCGALRPSSNTVQQRAADSVTFSSDVCCAGRMPQHRI
ncbi:hypothetical protein EYF80_042476 [Liparis tanakae]|uniref:Uncharacterized protein n=1 Tax=Liparis tanakae TaxID=230148 RepID=A0A4Z2G163_9TELE|nr:hypothetical protein EYF80_042476 [Liparis tanakae]